MISFIRYCSVQILTYLIDLGGFLFLLYSDLFGPIAANVIAKAAAAVVAFTAHRHFTFSVGEKSLRFVQSIRYGFLLVLNIPLSNLIFYLLLLVITPVVFAKFIADVIFVFANYLLSKKLVFSDHQTIIPYPR